MAIRVGTTAHDISGIRAASSEFEAWGDVLFSIDPLISARTATSYTITGTLAEVGDIFVVAILPSALDPSIEQIIAGTDGNNLTARGTGSQLSATAFSIVIDDINLDDNPIHDIFIVGRTNPIEGPLYTGERVQRGEWLTAPAGFTHFFTEVPWPSGSRSVYEDAVPPVVNGDVYRHSILTVPSDYTVTVRPDGTFIFSVEDNGQSKEQFEGYLWRSATSTWTALQTVIVYDGISVVNDIDLVETGEDDVDLVLLNRITLSPFNLFEPEGLDTVQMEMTNPLLNSLNAYEEGEDSFVASLVSSIISISPEGTIRPGTVVTLTVPDSSIFTTLLFRGSSIAFTAPTGSTVQFTAPDDFLYGNITLRLVDSSGGWNEGEITFAPIVGNAFITISSYPPIDPNDFLDPVLYLGRHVDPEPQNGMQLEYVVPLEDVTIFNNTTYQNCSVDDTQIVFRVIYSDGVASTYETIDVFADAETVGSFSMDAASTISVAGTTPGLSIPEGAFLLGAIGSLSFVGEAPIVEENTGTFILYGTITMSALGSHPIIGAPINLVVTNLTSSSFRSQWNK